MSYGTALDNIAFDFIILENFVQKWSDINRSAANKTVLHVPCRQVISAWDSPGTVMPYQDSGSSYVLYKK